MLVPCKVHDFFVNQGGTANKLYSSLAENIILLRAFLFLYAKIKSVYGGILYDFVDQAMATFVLALGLLK